jgi:hypothetical protein
LVDFHENFRTQLVAADPDGYWWASHDDCSACKREIIYLDQSPSTKTTPYGPDVVISHVMVRPRGIARTPLPSEVPEKFAADYREACLVLADSAKASAALGRRCLQHLLREVANIKDGNLSNEIQQVIDSAQLPSDLADSLDAVRVTGNFAAHPIKSTNTGEVVPVQSGEAEWNLEVLEELFDHYFVRPARLKAKRDALNQKLTDAGKPQMKATKP